MWTDDQVQSVQVNYGVRGNTFPRAILHFRKLGRALARTLDPNNLLLEDIWVSLQPSSHILTHVQKR